MPEDDEVILDAIASGIEADVDFPHIDGAGSHGVRQRRTHAVEIELLLLGFREGLLPILQDFVHDGRVEVGQEGLLALSHGLELRRPEAMSLGHPLRAALRLGIHVPGFGRHQEVEDADVIDGGLVDDLHHALPLLACIVAHFAAALVAPVRFVDAGAEFDRFGEDAHVDIAHLHDVHVEPLQIILERLGAVDPPLVQRFERPQVGRGVDVLDVACPNGVHVHGGEWIGTAARALEREVGNAPRLWGTVHFEVLPPIVFELGTLRERPVEFAMEEVDAGFATTS